MPSVLLGGEVSVSDGVTGLGPISADVLAKCYDEMRIMARRIMAGNVMARVLQPTELANEAAIRLIRTNLANAQNQGHLLAIAARMMRQVLVDEARKAASVKRNAPLFMTQWPGDQKGGQMDIGDLDEAIAALTGLSPERAQIVELRFMLGMTVEETAAATGQAERTVKRHWQAARAWLLDYLSDQDRA